MKSTYEMVCTFIDIVDPQSEADLAATALAISYIDVQGVWNRLVALSNIGFKSRCVVILRKHAIRRDLRIKMIPQSRSDL
jgi:hypothetical protein